MNDEGWEERMAQRAHQRAAAREAAAEAERIANDPHATHHTHLRGTAVECSCGELFGVTCVAIDPDYDPDDLECDRCGARGVVRPSGVRR